MFLNFLQKKSGAAKERRQGQAIDKAMNYCPGCGDEFRSDIDSCPVCRLVLRRGQELLAESEAREADWAGRDMNISPEEELVALRQGPLLELKALRRLLAAERVPALLSGDPAGGCRRGCGGPVLSLLVRVVDLPLATRVATADFLRTTAMDDDQLLRASTVIADQAAEMLCPACGGRFPASVGACPDCGLCLD
jgi:hypothetical protein